MQKPIRMSALLDANDARGVVTRTAPLGMSFETRTGQRLHGDGLCEMIRQVLKRFLDPSIQRLRLPDVRSSTFIL